MLRATINTQPKRAAGVVSTPQKATTPAPINANPMVVVVAKLANLQTRYLSDLQAARDKVKKNFLP